jgi:hypothetical protein
LSSPLLLVPGRPRRSSVALRLSASISMGEKERKVLAGVLGQRKREERDELMNS